MFKRALFILLLLASPAFAKYPYDSVGRTDAGGSAVLVEVQGTKGLVVTNAHVLTTQREMKVYWPAVKATRVCKPVFVDKDTDYALMVCDNPPVEPVKCNAPTRNSVIVAGFPYYEREHLHWQIGNVTSKTKYEVLYTNLPVPGMSGGAAFDLNGQLVGIVKGHDEKHGILVSAASIMVALKHYNDSRTWVPSYDHVEKPRNWNYATPDGKKRTLRYFEWSALDLKD